MFNHHLFSVFLPPSLLLCLTPVGLHLLCTQQTLIRDGIQSSDRKDYLSAFYIMIHTLYTFYLTN